MTRPDRFVAEAVTFDKKRACYHQPMASSERWPLSGLRVLVTRASDQGESFARMLRDLGAQPVTMPTIDLAPPESWDDVDAAIARLDDYDGVIFTSANGVTALGGRLEALGHAPQVLGRIAQLAAIGPATAKAMIRMGLRADLVADEPRAEGLFAALLARGVVGRRFLLPCAEQARDVLPDSLAEAGAIVDVVTAYRTVPGAGAPGAMESLRRGEIDMVTFASPSAVENFAAIAPDSVAAAARVLVAVIGPVTREACERLGLRVDIEAAPYTMAGLLEAIERHYRRRD